MELKRIVGANLRHHRRAHGFTQEELAEKTDISVQMLGMIERGETSPSFETISGLAEALDVPAVAFFGAGTMVAPAGERGKLLHRVNAALSVLNDDDLARVARMLEAFAAR